MGVVEFTDAINTRLTAVLAALTPPQAPPVYHFGKDALALQEDAPRVVWVPKQGSADGKIMKAADAGPDFGVPAGTDFPTPRPLWRRMLNVEAHVWGIRADLTTDPKLDYVAAEKLANHLVAAAQNVGFGSYEMKGENWDTTLTNQGASTRRGAVVSVTFALELPWTDERDATGVVTVMPVRVGSAHA